MRASKPFALLTLVAGFFGVISLAPQRANAESPQEDRAMAEALFRDGKALMNAGNPKDACPKLAESQRLDPGGGTQLLLGLCLEQAGQLASAWVELNDALSTAQREGNEMRQEVARAHIDSLSPRLARIEFVFGAGGPREGLTITQNGGEIPRAAWSTELPVDSGKHVIVFDAPGCEPVAREVEVSREGVTVPVEVPVLEVRAAAVEPLAPQSEVPAPVPTEHPAQGSSRKTVGYVVSGGGVAAIAAGAVFGIRAISLNNQVEEACPDTNCDRLDLQEEYSMSKTSATWSTVFFGVGLAGVATGVYLLLTDDADSSAVQASPDAKFINPAAQAKVSHWDLVATNRGGSIQLQGSF